MTKILRAMGTEEVVKFLQGEELVSKAKHSPRATNSQGFCFADGKDIYDVMQHLIGVVDDSVILVGTLKAKPVHTFKKGWGKYANHKELPEDAGQLFTQTIEMLGELSERMINEKDGNSKDTRLVADEWSTKKYSQEDFSEWKLYMKQKPTDAVLTARGLNDFQKDIAKDLNSAQWMAPKLVGKSKK